MRFDMVTLKFKEVVKRAWLVERKTEAKRGQLFCNAKSPALHANKITTKVLYLEPRGWPFECLTVPEVFDPHFRTGRPITLIACSSGRTHVGINGDLLGLTTGMHYAGASSITSTLWPVDNENGAIFAESFL